MSFRVVNGKITRVEELEVFRRDTRLNDVQSKNSFKEILDSKINKSCNINISKHAAQRLEDRNINLSEEDIKALDNGLNLAQEKGSKESLILYKDIAFLASVKNRTIITAVEKNNNENVFTNIDSVVLL
ncbi:MAG: TIGR02530 family flagellar biosynthesis protein [Clostridiaceae bacterium]